MYAWALTKSAATLHSNPSEGGTTTATFPVNCRGVAGSIAQIPSSVKSVTLANSDGSFSDQLAVGGSNSAVTYVGPASTSGSHMTVTLSGAITTVNGPLPESTCTSSGTDVDTDTCGGFGTRSYSLKASPQVRNS